MTVSRRTTVMGTAALSATLALAACNGAEPVVGPTGSSSSTSSTTTTAPPTTTSKPTTSTTTPTVDPVLAKIPKAARPETMQGAEAFAKFYIDSLNTGSTGKDFNALKGLYKASCIACVSMNATLQELKKKGHHNVGDSIAVVNSEGMNQSATSTAVLLDVHERSVRVVDEAGNLVRRTNTRDSSFVMTLSFSERRWTVVRLQPAT